MRVVEIAEGRRLRLGERQLPELVGTDVLIDVGFCGICGTDLHMRDALPAGTVLGHEFAGTVAAMGPQVTGWAVGELASVLIYTSCGSCRYCLAGAENHCVVGGHHGRVLGVNLQGGYAESVIADVSTLYRLPEGMSLEHAALAEPVSIGVRAAGTVDTPLDDPVLVIGAGPIGLFAGFALRAKGHRHVFVVDRNPARAAAARELGFDTLDADDLASALALRGVDQPGAVVECAAAPAAARAAVKLLRRQGRLVLVGLPEGDVSFDAQAIVINEIQIRGSAGCSRADFAKAIDLLASGAVPADKVITATRDFEEADELFDQLLDPATPHVKILLRP